MFGGAINVDAYQLPLLINVSCQLQTAIDPSARCVGVMLCAKRFNAGTPCFKIASVCIGTCRWPSEGLPRLLVVALNFLLDPGDVSGQDQTFLFAHIGAWCVGLGGLIAAL